MKTTITVTLLLLTTACTQPQPRSFPVPVQLPQRITAPDVPELAGVPHAVRVGLTVHIGGMVPVNAAGQLVGQTLEAQTGQALSNLFAVVAAARGLPDDVVRVTAYVRDLTPEAVETVRSVLVARAGGHSLPTLTVVGVDALPEAGMQVMLEGTAQLRSEFPDRTRM